MAQQNVASTMAWRQTIPVDRLIPNPDNPRQDPGELSDLDLERLEIPALEKSIRKQGLKQPLLVTLAQDMGTPDDSFWYIEDGWRRWLAMKDWMTDIPCVISPPLPGENRHVRNILTALVTSVQRLDLDPIQKAKAFWRLQDEFGLTQGQIAEQTGMSVSTVSNSLALLELSVDTQKRVAKGVKNGGLSIEEALKAVRRRRRIARRAKGGTGQAGAVWEPDWFTVKHPLSYRAEALCDRREHNSRRRIGASGTYAGACGQCWQSMIEADYEQVLVSAGWQRPSNEQR